MSDESTSEKTDAERLTASGKRINEQFKERVALHEALYGKYEGTDDWGPADANTLIPQATVKVVELKAEIAVLVDGAFEAARASKHNVRLTASMLHDKDARIHRLEVALIEIRDNSKVDTGTRNHAMTALTNGETP